MLLGLPQAQIASLIRELEGASKGLPPQELSNYLSERIELPSDESYEIVQILYSLYRLKAETSLSTNELAENICVALQEEKQDKLKPKDGNWNAFERNLIKLMSVEKTIGSTFRALNLSTEYEKSFVDAKVFTDIRPAFGSDLSKKVDTAIVIHNLQIEYHTSGEHVETYIALDGNDLRTLKAQIDEAIKKEESLVSSFEDKIFFVKPQK